jgi:hypothetical protein
MAPRMARVSTSSAGPPAISARGSRFPWSATVSGTAEAAQRGSMAVSMPTACTPARCAYSASIGPAKRGKPISGMSGGSRFRSSRTSAAVGSMTQRRNCAGGSSPAQLSKSISASAPASAWATR